MEGYGIFWALLEVLRAQPDYTYPLENIPLVAYKYRTESEKVRRRLVFSRTELTKWIEAGTLRPEEQRAAAALRIAQSANNQQ